VLLLPPVLLSVLLLSLLLLMLLNVPGLLWTCLQLC
jgi:hypothetical protein